MYLFLAESQLFILWTKNVGLALHQGYWRFFGYPSIKTEAFGEPTNS